MRRDAELLQMLLKMVADIEDLTAQAMNAGCEDTRIIRLGLMLAGMFPSHDPLKQIVYCVACLFAVVNIV